MELKYYVSGTISPKDNGYQSKYELSNLIGKRGREGQTFWNLKQIIHVVSGALGLDTS